MAHRLASSLLVAAVSIFGTTLLCPSPSAASDEICAQLRTFEAAPFESGHDGKPLRKSVTFVWKGPWLGENMAWECRRKISDPSAVALCKYLMNNTSLEFRANLPIRVLSCYGYQFRQFAAYDWHDWTADVTLQGHKDDQTMLMEIDLGEKSSPDAAVRI